MAKEKRAVILHRIEIRTAGKRMGELWLSDRLEWHPRSAKKYYHRTWSEFDEWMSKGKPHPSKSD